MEWRDEGILLAARPQGEADAFLEVFTALHGRHAGVLKGGGSRKRAATLQPGGQLDVTWRARLESHVGSYTVDLQRARAGSLLGDRLALAALGAATALCRFALPERMAYPGFYSQTVALMDRLGQPGWLRDYALWEVLLLEATGFGLDLQQCAVTGLRAGLAYVSPRTGAAVTAAAAGDYAPRLLPLPAGLIDPDVPFDAGQLRQALQLSGYFLQTWLATAQARPLPEARARLLQVVS
ncbi:MAG: DNA repair protein RecO [Roseinatronobacter sp.]